MHVKIVTLKKKILFLRKLKKERSRQSCKFNQGRKKQIHQKQVLLKRRERVTLYSPYILKKNYNPKQQHVSFFHFQFTSFRKQLLGLLASLNS